MTTSLESWPLPGELVDAILDMLEPRDLARVAQVSRALRRRALDDRWWQKFIQRNLPPACAPVSATPLPAHLSTFRDLYVAHEAHWFLPRHKIWFSGPDMVGKLIVVRYDPRRGCIEGYQLVAVSRSAPGQSTEMPWPYDPRVVVQAFQPEVSVHLDRPVLKLDAHAPAVPTRVTGEVRVDKVDKDDEEKETQDDKADDKEDGTHEKQDKGKAKADEAPQTDAGPVPASSTDQPPQKRPKISIYQPPGTSFSWGAYAQAITSDTPAIDPICPRIRPELMDLDGVSGASSSSSASTTTTAAVIRLAPSSGSRIRRQFIFARPLSSENAYYGGMAVPPPRMPYGMRSRTHTPPSTEPEIGSADDFEESRRTLPRRNTLPYPQYSIWPPPEVPAPHRVRATDISPHHYPQGPIGQPRLRTDVSERAFHVRTYIESNVDLQRALAMLKPVRRPAQAGDAAEAAQATETLAAASVPTPTSTSTSTDASTATPTPTPDAPTATRPAPAMPPASHMAAVAVANPLANNAAASIRRDTLETYATLDPLYYTPTEDQPFRGIFVGDYSSHGCEFLLVHQADEVIEMGSDSTVRRNVSDDGSNDSDSDDDGEGVGGSITNNTANNTANSTANNAASNETATALSSAQSVSPPVRMDGESDEAFAARVRDDRIYRGSIRAIKLTGDPNVPRGEVSFVAPDLGPGGLDTVMADAPFAGVRVVKSKGHVAGTRFINDRWVETRLLLISPDRLAMFWVGFGHVNFFERVDIDKYVDALGVGR